MAKLYKPAGYTSVAPYLVVNGAADTIRFLEKVFAAEHLRSFPGPGGKLMHAEVRIDDTVIMLADASESVPPRPADVHVYVPDVDGTYRLAIEAGAEPIQEPVKKQDPDKRGAFRDPGGITWWVGTKIE